jgi:hypothetical protein
MMVDSLNSIICQAADISIKKVRYTDKNIKSTQNKKQNKLKWFDQSLVGRFNFVLKWYRGQCCLEFGATFFIPDIFIWHKWEIFVIFFMCKVKTKNRIN